LKRRFAKRLLRRFLPMFRFTIRDVLWLTVVVAMGVGWFLTAQRAALLNARLQAVTRIAELRAKELRGEVILEPIAR
jgi:hypothetical protein